MFTTWQDPSPLVDQLENITMSAHVQNAHDFEIVIYNETGLVSSFAAYYLRLETYMNGRWIPVYSRSMFCQESNDFLILEPGPSKYAFDTRHFTRQFDGPFRMSVFIEQESRVDWHQLTYIFSNGG